MLVWHAASRRWPRRPSARPQGARSGQPFGSAVTDAGAAISGFTTDGADFDGHRSGFGRRRLGGRGPGPTGAASATSGAEGSVLALIGERGHVQARVQLAWLRRLSARLQLAPALRTAVSEVSGFSADRTPASGLAVAGAAVFGAGAAVLTLVSRRSRSLSTSPARRSAPRWVSPRFRMLGGSRGAHAQA